MTPRIIKALLPAALFLAAATASLSARWDGTRAPFSQENEQSAAMNSALSVIADWPENARALAARLIHDHGVPDQISAAELAWSDQPPWKRIVVYRDAESTERPNNLQESVSYEVPLSRWRALNAFDRGVAYEPVRRELVSRSDREEANILALNLADEVVQGKRAPSDAAAFYDRTLELSYSGKSSPYMSKLMFSPLSRRFLRKEARDGARRDRDLLRLENENDRLAPAP